MSKHKKTAYELSQSQVSTPAEVVGLFWHLTRKRRRRLPEVLDMGAGDGRFAIGGIFGRYTGVEIDQTKLADAALPPNAIVIKGCVFKHLNSGYDACIGNPPYVRHHDIESFWKEKTVSRMEDALGISINRHCNLYLYFFFLALSKTNKNGLVSLVIPYEWVSRPSALPLRNYIQRNAWNVEVYRFQAPIFKNVLTTASITIVDKKARDGHWKYFDVTPDLQVVSRHGVAGSTDGILEYASRGRIWGLRGLSPGSQRIFTLTEGERIHNGLTKHDVVPCVTTLKFVPRPLKALTRASFTKYFVNSGARCWLIKSDRKNRSPRLDAYLQAVSSKQRDTYTCRHQKPWYNFKPHPVPQILFSSGFTTFGPKVLINSVGARAVGSVLGVHSCKELPRRQLQEYLLGIDFEKRVVAHAKTLKKIEVKQLNAVLNSFVDRGTARDRK